MRLHGFLASLKQTSVFLSPPWLARANASSHFFSSSSSLQPNPGSGPLSESDSNSKHLSPVADDKLGSSGVTTFKAKDLRSRKGKPSSSLSDLGGFSSSASKPARSAKAKVYIDADKEKPSTFKAKKRSKSYGQAQVRVIPSDKPCSSSDRHPLAQISESHHHARSSANHLKNSTLEDSGTHSESSNGIATTSHIKPKRLRRAFSEIEVSHNPCTEKDQLAVAAKLRRSRKGSLAEIVDNDDDTNNLSNSTRMVVPAKKVSKHARVKAQGVCPSIPCTEMNGDSGTPSSIGHVDAEGFAHPPEVQASTEGKLSRKITRNHAKERASAVSESLLNVSSGPDVDGKYQVSNGKGTQAAAEIPKAKHILEENHGLEFLDVHPMGKSRGPPNQEVTVETRQNFDGSPVQYEGEIISENHGVAGQMPVKESKKSLLLVAFPVLALSRWWVSCYLNTARDFADLTDPLMKTHFWVTAYQRAFSRMTGKYCDGETICSVVKKLRNLQFTVVRNKFKWADESNVYLPSPLTESAKTVNSSEASIASAFQDDVVEDVLLLVLEPIFEARFSARSHAFRPERDAHTALSMVRKSLQGCTWFFSGNVSSRKLCSSYVLESLLRMVKDMRVLFLLKSGFLRDKWMGTKMEEVDKSSMGLNPDPSMRLKFLLWNVFLDQLDQWMEARIHILLERKHLNSKGSSNFICRSATISARKAPKMEYVRYGANFLVGLRGSQKEAETLGEGVLGFLKRRMSGHFDRNQLPLHHISDGVEFLDHIISQKIAYPVMCRRIASNGKTFEKRACRIRLCLKASRESCVLYLKQIGSPASFEEIKNILSILNNWYFYAEDRVKIIDYCKLCLCKLYVKKVLGEKQSLIMSRTFLKWVKEILEDPVAEKDFGDKRLSRDGVWLLEHEKNLKELAWLENEAEMEQVVEDFRHRSMLSPQQHSARVVWDFSRSSYPLKGDHCGEAEPWMHWPPRCVKERCLTDLKSEELSECAV